MKCSVVILNWNGAEMLRRFLPSVLCNTQDTDCEIIVADNGSTDKSRQVLVEEFPTVRTILLDKNYGFAGGYNRAISLIDSELVVLLNSDVEVTAHWLTPLLAYMEEHMDVVAVQPKIHSLSDRSRFEHAGAAGGYIDILGYPFCRGRLMNKTEIDHGQYDCVEHVLWTSGACMCVRTHIYKELGGLDEQFFAHMEEIDLCWRLNSRGYKLMGLPYSTVYHLGGGSLNYEHPRKTYLNFRNNLLMIYKNMPTQRLWWIMLCRFFLDYLASIQMLLTGKPKNAWAVLCARWDYHSMRRQFTEKRKENIQNMCVPYPMGWKKCSILWDYYVLRK